MGSVPVNARSAVEAELATPAETNILANLEAEEVLYIVTVGMDRVGGKKYICLFDL